MNRKMGGLLLVALAGCGELPKDIEQAGSVEQPTIYGNDNRTDWYQVSDPTILSEIDSSPAIWQSGLITPNADGVTTHLYTPGPYSSGFSSLCPEERFYNQTYAGTGPWCSSALVGPDLVLTAHHCVFLDDGSDATPYRRVIFGFHATDATHVVTDVPNTEIYQMAQIVRTDATQDWAIVRLDRPVPNHRPVQVRRAGTALPGTPLHIIGYPDGLSVKYSPYAMAFSASDPNFPSWDLLSDVDALGGNSGSPVYNSVSGQIEDVEIGGGADFVFDTTRSCWKSVVWAPNTQVFERGPRLPLISPYLEMDNRVNMQWYNGCAVLGDGRLACWGFGSFGEIGDGTLNTRNTPTIVPGLRDVVEVAVGEYHICARLADQTVRCWGQNTYGQLGDGTTTNRSSPVVVPGLNNVTKLTAGAFHTCARLADRTVRCWGYNSAGQLGNGTTTNSSTPVVVGGLGNVADLAASWTSTSCAVLLDGTARCWGFGYEGQLGNGSGAPVTQLTPVAVSGLSNALRITGGSTHFCALLGDNTVRCWGRNALGELGDGTTTDRYTPVAPPLSGVTDVRTGGETTCARNVAGNLWCWGSNNYGQLADGTTTARTSPFQIPGIADVTDFGVANTVLVRYEDGRLSAWGNNAQGQLGDGTVVSTRNTPASVPPLANVVEISGGARHTCERLLNGSVRCTGNNAMGQLGDGTTTSRTVPTPVLNLTPALQIAAGDFHTCALLGEGSVTCWGDNTYRQLGDPNFAGSNRPTPTPTSVVIDNTLQVAGGTSNAYARRNDGTVWAWGDASLGALGDGSTAGSRPSPGPVSGISNATGIAAGNEFACALLSSGTISCWGYNAFGTLGDATNVTRYTPDTVNGISNAVRIAAGQYHVCALLADGTVRCWGYNGYGELGNGNTNTQWTPVAVSGLSNATQVVTGQYHTCALRSDGTVACWGYNSDGELGDGTQTNRLSPTTVPNLAAVKSISGSAFGTCAILLDGTSRCWGYNGTGRIGDGTLTSRSAPTSPTW